MPFTPKAFIATVTFALLVSLVSIAQKDKPSYQIGTIMEVKVHQPAPTDDSKKQYDIVVKVGGTLYTVLFTPKPGSKVAEYSAGTDRPVLVETDTLKFSDLLGNPVAVPIVSRKQISKKANSSPGN
jgi:hypothetical protein